MTVSKYYGILIFDKYTFYGVMFLSDEYGVFIIILGVMALILFHIVCAMATVNIYGSKNRKGGALWGLLLGILGILIAWLIVRKKGK